MPWRRKAESRNTRAKETECRHQQVALEDGQVELLGRAHIVGPDARLVGRVAT